MKWSIMVDNQTTGSDNMLLGGEVDADRQEEADHERVVWWNLEAMTKKDMGAVAKPSTELAMQTAHLDVECKEHKVE
jgi:hypothetical protein